MDYAHRLAVANDLLRRDLAFMAGRSKRTPVSLYWRPAGMDYDAWLQRRSVRIAQEGVYTGAGWTCKFLVPLDGDRAVIQLLSSSTLARGVKRDRAAAKVI